MSARFRRRGEIVEAVCFDGTNAEECCRVWGAETGERNESWVRNNGPGLWYMHRRPAIVDEQFREEFEPVPLPEPGPADAALEDAHAVGSRAMEERDALRAERDEAIALANKFGCVCQEPGDFCPTCVALSELSARIAESSAQVRRLASYIVDNADDPERCACVHDRREHRNGAGPCMHGHDGHVVDCASDCRTYQPDTEYREPAIVTECRAVLASPEAPRGSLADACAELARLQEPVAPEIQATLDSLPVLDLASAAPETPAKAWIEVRSGPLRRASAHLVTLNPHGVSGQTYEAHIVSALENPGYVSRIANEWAAALGLEVRR